MTVPGLVSPFSSMSINSSADMELPTEGPFR